MKIVELLQEIEDILDTSSGVPLTKMVMVNPEEIRDILNEIRHTLPEEIQQAQWIKDERNRILDSAKAEYNKLISDASAKASEMVESDIITLRANKRADDIIREAKDTSNKIKIGTCDYADALLQKVQREITDMNDNYINVVFSSMNTLMASLNQKLNQNREEVRAMVTDTQESMLEEAAGGGMAE